jgi:hypothetical protein
LSLQYLNGFHVCQSCNKISALSITTAMTSTAAKIIADKQLIKDHTCPVCGLCLSDAVLKDKHRSLKQHLSRTTGDKEHQLWCELYWRVHFLRGGYRLQPRVFTIEEIVAINKRYFGDSLSAALATKLQNINIDT